MATGLAAQLAAATTASFQQKVAVALVVAARTVKAESTAGMIRSRMDKRQRLADVVLASPGSAVGGASWMPSALTVTVAYAMASAGIDDTTADATIQTQITNNWDVIAGFSQADS